MLGGKQGHNLKKCRQSHMLTHFCLSGLAVLLVLAADCGDRPLLFFVTPAPKLQAGIVTTTANPIVSQYTISPGRDANVAVQFGMTASYGLQTSFQATTNGSVSILVAGMRQNTLYHMRALLKYPDGTTDEDVDHTFLTSAFPNSLALPTATAQTFTGTPQPGIELVAGISQTPGNYLQAYALV